MDSGADVSCLPADLGWLGTQGTGAKMKVSDAQGGILPVKQHRDVEFVVATRSGRPVLWKEKCVVTSVTQPLLSMGKFMRAGWFPTEDESGMFLRHGRSGTEVPIVFKGNSLMVHAKLRRVTESDTPIAPKSQVTGAQSSHATGAQSSQVTGAQSSQVTGAQSSQVTGAQSSQVTGSQSSQATGGQADQTANVQTAQSTGAHSGVQQYAQVRYTSARPSKELVDASYGWQTLESSGHFIWRGLSDHFIDPSLLVPITWPYRATLVYVDDGRKVLELCVAWQSLKDPIAFLPCGEAQCIVVLSSGEEDPSVFGVEVLGEVIQNSGSQDSDAMLLDDEPCVDAPAGASEPQEFAPALPEPVADQMEHVPASVQTDSNEPVVVDGIGLSMGSTLGALKAACLKLNLSQSGSKRRCLDRLRGYVQKQQLMAECDR